MRRENDRTRTCGHHCRQFAKIATISLHSAGSFSLSLPELSLKEIKIKIIKMPSVARGKPAKETARWPKDKDGE